MRLSRINKSLIFAGILSLLAAILQLAIIAGGPGWYRFFGAGETIAAMAEAGSTVPDMLTGCLSIILFIWSCYALSGAGLIRKLPLLRTGLLFISTIYLVGGLAPLIADYFQYQEITLFLYWTSGILLVFGLAHLIGTIQVWEDIRFRPSAW